MEGKEEQWWGWSPDPINTPLKRLDDIQNSEHSRDALPVLPLCSSSTACKYHRYECDYFFIVDVRTHGITLTVHFRCTFHLQAGRQALIVLSCLSALLMLIGSFLLSVFVCLLFILFIENSCSFGLSFHLLLSCWHRCVEVVAFIFIVEMIPGSRALKSFILML